MSCAMKKKESVFSFIGLGEVEEPIESKVRILCVLKKSVN